MTSTYTTPTTRERYPDAQAMVDVVPTDAQRWQAALDDAQEAVMSVDRRRTLTTGGVTMTAFVISGRDAPGIGYGVVVARDGNNLHTMCDCEAGRDSRICWHAARAIDELGYWPASVGVTSYQRPTMVGGEPRCPVCGGNVQQSQRLVMPRGFVWFVRCVACGWRVEA